MPFKQDNRSKRFFNCYKIVTIQYRYKTVTHTAEILIIWLNNLLNDTEYKNTMFFIRRISSDMLSETLHKR